jgi:hypothetical protein
MRLTVPQYAAAVKQVLQVDVATSDFLADASFTGYSTENQTLVVSDRHVRDFQRSAEAVVSTLLSTPGKLESLVGCPLADGEPCVDRFIRKVGLSVFRRPLGDPEVDAFLGLFRKSPMLTPPGGSSARVGVGLIVEAMLQSPEFLYRLELPINDSPEATPLTPFELASRLAFALTNSPPDATLLGLAMNGTLVDPSVLRQEATRLLASPEAKESTHTFHHQWLRVDRYKAVKRDAARFPAFNDRVPAALGEETRQLIEELVVEKRRGVSALLSADSVFVNDATAPLYGLAKPDPMKWLKLKTGPERSGMLTHLGYLATNAYFDKTDPIHRGVFLHQKILCTPLPAPSPDAAGVPEPPYSDTIRTRREQVSAHTGQGSCLACHRLINPAGFAFEHYDAVGQYRAEDRTLPIDASGALAIDGASFQFQNGVELSRHLAKSQQVSTCYATQWFRYLAGRVEDAADTCSIAAVAALKSQESPGIDQLTLGFVEQPAFLTRATGDAP